MQIERICCLIVLALLTCLMPVSAAQVTGITRTLYQINSGTYTIQGGLAGDFQRPLPNASQAYVSLVTNQQTGKAEMAILGSDQKTVFLSLSNGLVSGTTIHFFYPMTHPYPNIPEMGTVECTTTNVSGTLQFNCVIQYPSICCDIPDLFRHSNVTASAMAQLAIRISEVELTWGAESNRLYQVQYRSDETTNQWTDLGEPRLGSGTHLTITDRIPASSLQRQYRVLNKQ